MDDLDHCAVVPGDHRNVPRPDLTQIQFIYRPAAILDWDGQQVPVRERWMAIWRDDQQDVLRSWYPRSDA